MKITVSDIPSEGLAIEALDRSPFADPAWRLDRVRLRLDREGADVLVTGDVEATVPVTCGRCLAEFGARVRSAVDVRFVPRPAGAETMELGADDLDTDFYVNDEVDLSGLIETETTLTLPMRPLCREDCRGLCPTCGANRNETPCACQDRPPDPRLAVLRDLAARLPR
jgi:uncharacterized protein